MTDPFDRLRADVEPQEPRPSFARALRDRLVAVLDIDDVTHTTIDLPERNHMTTRQTTTTAVTDPVLAYLTVSDGAAAIRFYEQAFGAVEEFRVVGDDGRLGHAELVLGPARIMLSDEFPEMGVTSPTTLGGSSVALYLPVADCDAAHASAVVAGSTSLSAPGDQTHGNRTATVLDPFGHRWMLSQPLEAFDLDRYAERENDYEVVAGATSCGGPTGAIWAALNFADAPAGIGFLTDVLGFEIGLVVPSDADSSVIEHAQLRWPEGGIIQAGSAGRGTPYSDRPTGTESVYVVTVDPAAVHGRCVAAGADVIDPLHEVHYGGTADLMFSVRDPEGNIFSFGSYAGG